MLSSYGLQMCQVVRRKRQAAKSTEMIDADDLIRPAKKQRTGEAVASPAVEAAVVSEVDDIGIDEIDGEADQLLEELVGFDVSEDSTVMGLVSASSSFWGAYSLANCPCCKAPPKPCSRSFKLRFCSFVAKA